MRKIKIKGNILLQYSFLLNKIVKFSPKKCFFEKLSPLLDSDFSLLAILKLVLKIFRQVLRIYRHLMLKPSWDANQ
jgi:hypothetical protein